MKVKLSLRENRIINIFKNKIEEKFPEEKIKILVLGSMNLEEIKKEISRAEKSLNMQKFLLQFKMTDSGPSQTYLKYSKIIKSHRNYGTEMFIIRVKI